jgi:SWI/SNF-related matrix-associated actin-dependent regulator of chromatin subfamily A member 5
MLRRLKADVEKSLPAKHETILFTGMSTMQKQLYRDILMVSEFAFDYVSLLALRTIAHTNNRRSSRLLQRDLDALQGASGSRTAILNIVMQLRKCAGHPYLFPGVEDRSLPPLGEHLVEHCGKMVLLDKLLRRLKEGGHRVLLFTQVRRTWDSILPRALSSSISKPDPYCFHDKR